MSESDPPSQGGRPQLPPPGWYPDPYDASGQRFWDGARWTEHARTGAAGGARTAGASGAGTGAGPLGAGGAPMGPGGAAAGPGGQMIDTWLWQSIVVTVACCMPLGIAGIVTASQASTALSVGDYDLARRKADQAKQFSLIGAGAFVVLFGGLILLMVLGVVGVGLGL